MNCRDCDWWSKDDDDGGGVWYPMGWGTCSSAKIKLGHRPPIADAAYHKAQVEDDVGLGLVTSPDFGCVLYKKKA